MKTLTTTLLALAATQLVATAATTTISGANVRGFNDENGTALGAGILGVLVVNTATGEAGDTGFTGVINVSPGALNLGSTLDPSGNLLILNLIDSENNALEGLDEINGAGSGNVIDLDTSAAATGDEYAVFWFSSLSLGGGNTTAAAGDAFGVARESDWLVGAGGSNPTISPVTNAGNANLTVTPEPASAALLGLGALGFAMRRRRA